MASSNHLNSTAATSPHLSSLRLRSPRWRFGLGAKLLLIVTLVSLVGVLTSSLLLENWHRNQLIENAELAADQLSVPIQASLRHAMLTHDAPLINAIVQSLADEPGVQRIRIVDANGRVRTG